MSNLPIDNIQPEKILFSAFDIELNRSISKDKIISMLNDIKFHNTNIIDLQAFRFNSLLSEKQLLSAIWHAWNGYKNELMISDMLSIEFLLYVSGQRQISKALKFFGLEFELDKFSLVIFHKEPILEKQFISFPFIRNISELRIINTNEKTKFLAKIFNFNFRVNDDFLSSQDDFIKLENYILSSISNLVFETGRNRMKETT
jgi:tRNA threonylcarbamoyladenosine modification (KEOPS) complex Cgi121 subunit